MVAFTQYAERTEHRPIEIGSTRTDVEGKLGDPVSIETRADGSVIATYKETLTDFSEFWAPRRGLALSSTSCMISSRLASRNS